MTELERRAAVFSRVDELQHHAAALEDAFADDTVRCEARQIRERLQRARTELEAVMSLERLDDVEHLVDSASVLLASLGRVA